MKNRILLTILTLLGVTLSLQAEERDSLQNWRIEEITAHRNNRGLVNLENEFVPKGQWIVGITASYSTHINDNYSFTLVKGINSEGYTVCASPIVAYSFRDNLSAGVRFEYGRSRLTIDSATLSIEGDVDPFELDIVDYYALQNSYTAMAILRRYIPLGETNRFALFAEARLEVGGSRAKFAYDQPVVGTFSEGYSVGFGVVPGIVAFATNNVAFEVTVGMLGVGYSYTEQIHNQVYTGEVESSNISFKLNLLSIGLGVAFYF
ncbi:MAG: hypothetical protein SNF68_00125 [Rikenellaceae bacterium]